MNPLNATKTMKNIVVTRLKKRNAMRTIQASPSLFEFLPTEPKRYQAALYFADSTVNAYQIRQWYEPFRKLSQLVPVVVIVRNPETAVALRDECPLPIYFGPSISAIESMLATQDIRSIFYVNQNIRNFQMMRFNEPAHIFISHGESEKAYMWSNQLKAYDYVFAAGQAARDRLAKNLLRYDVPERTRLVGRPQIDVAYPAPVLMNSDFKTVLYAPTWEGDRPSMAYGSVSSHGISMLKDLVSKGEFNIIFRPHPRSGVNDANYKADISAIREILAAATTSDSPTYLFDESDSWGWQWSTADVCVTDISAVAYDWMATGKPMLVTTPANILAKVDDSPALLKVPSLSSENAGEASKKLSGILKAPDSEISDVVEYYFGDTKPGASMQRFLDESIEIIEDGHRAATERQK